MSSVVNMRQKARKHIPERTCIACHSKTAKRELIRIVRTPEGRVEVDMAGKKSGRGAYLCARKECWKIGLKGSKLDHALHTTVSMEDKRILSEFAAELPE